MKLTLFLLTCLLPTLAFAAETPPPATHIFAEVDGHPLALDLHLPAASASAPTSAPARPPVIVWVHGGAWRAGSRKDMPLTKLVTAGYAIASVDYRLSITARFPAQVHDLKAAIRYLRANATKLGLNADKIAIAGASAGAHLAALVGVTNGHRELEGTVGVTGPSSDVHAIVSFFGMSDLTTILSQSTTHGLSVRVPALQLLLGGQPDAVPVLARLASPVFHVDASDPPLLLIHGDQDPQAPFAQSRALEAAYQRAKRPVQFETIPGGLHGGPQFYDAERLALARKFLDALLR
ncbi:lipase [Verrucomicrobiota bacterium]|nr:lipase [Verrucomicrobiota bacterium]